MDDSFLSRTELLFGREKTEQISSLHVFIAGIGAVGSFAVEALARTGVSRFTLVDFDTVDASNINRQLIATSSTIGHAKTELMKARILDINPLATITTHNLRLSSDFSIINIAPNVIIDAIDDLPAKVALAIYAISHNIPIVSSMGAARRLDPTLVRHAPLAKVTGCPLAKAYRKALSQHVDLASLPETSLSCTYSIEPPMPQTCASSRAMGSFAPVTGTFGLTIAANAIKFASYAPQNRFLVISLSPAVDVALTLSSFPKDDSVFKNPTESQRLGGKAINVASYIAKQGYPVTLIGLMGSDDADIYNAHLTSLGITNRFSIVPGSVRRNTTFLTPNGSFKVNRPTFPHLNEFDIPLPQNLTGTTVIISGSLPQNFAPDYYKRLITRLRPLSPKRIILDTSGAPLKYAISANPDIIKPNKVECEELVGFSLHSPSDFLRATSILNKSVPYVIISDGANGAYFNGEFIPAPPITPNDTTGAGDTLLADFAIFSSPTSAVFAASSACEKR